MSQTEQKYQEREIDFRETIQPGAGVRVTRALEMPGTITQIMFHFPPGCNGLVDMKLFKSYEPFYPTGALFIALDNATPVYYVTADYDKLEPLTVEIQNRDSVNPHTVTCSVVIRFVQPSWWW